MLFASEFALAHGDVVDHLGGQFLAHVRLRGGGGAAFGWLVGVCDCLLCGCDARDEG